jgi:hypothetical protein
MTFAAQTTTTPQTPAKAPPAAAVAAPPAAEGEGDSKGLMDLLNDLPEPSVSEGEADEATTDGAEAETAEEKSSPAAATEPAATTDDESALEPDEKLLTDEALSTPEGVKRAAEVMRAAAKAYRSRSAALDRFDMRLGRREKTLRTKAETFEREVGPTRAMASRATECFRVLDPGSGASAKQRLDAIGLLAAGDPARGQEFYEQWSIGIATDGKQPPPPIDREARARLERLERERTSGDEARERERLTGEVEKKQAEIVEAAKDAAAYPALAAQLENSPEAAAEVADYATALMRDYYGRTGRTLAKEKALAIIETRLAKVVGDRAGRAGSPGDGSGTPTKTPSSPARSAGRGTTVLPSSADRSTGIVREPKSLEERTQMNARDPEFMDSLFGTRWRSDDE